MKEILLTELINEAKEAIKPIRHSKSTVYQYGLAWDELSHFFESNGQTFFTKELATMFVHQSKADFEKGRIKYWRFKLRRLSVLILIEVLETGSYSWKLHFPDANAELSIEMKQLHAKYTEVLIRSGKGKGTRRLYETLARQFLKYVQSELNKNMSDLQLDNVQKFIPYIAETYQSTSMRTVLSALRSFLKFLYKEEMTKEKLVLAVPSSGSKKNTVIPTITKDEENRLLQSINRFSRLGKRNYAMVLLAMRTGLRSIDIINLKLSNIDWRNKTIVLVQQKNRRPLTLPLLSDVGNALSDYILNARPPNDLPYVFLRYQSPHTKLSRSTCYSISCSIMKKADIRQSVGQRKGFHIFRHSVAARMLSQEISLSMISNSLGHGSISSGKVYLSTDEKHLKACALSFEGIEVTKEELL
ncbi:site-specific integrase [Tetragenococcus koreensis]|uniref:site-specific integrase n=1 Tax=Tetragenococcus koreensis TaxID=290335 RepID=UPI001F328DAB|nr:site-specific integrase [Tetragenococcus koreensis]MDN6294560.1 site-specific integrase [Alkalibacterium sp.]MCF1586430.1 site-specific integrase [Tetragenococcus koreensis]MCF1615977.1 site-specific integrase [Tetragenococcus koreensis]MCF1625758.1 site-specific integrase [Tetragenococcus koreensis]MCF1630665.1 site-specific integrase [Tetragenococcus koreensis]